MVREMIPGVKQPKKRSPFYSSFKGLPPAQLSTQLPGVEYPVLLELAPGSLLGREMRQFIFRKDDKYVNVPIPDYLKTPQEFKSTLAKLDLMDAEAVAIFCDESEIPLMTTLAASLPKKFNFQEANPLPKRLQFQGECYVSPRYFRAIAKVAFHYFLANFSDIDGADRCFRAIRRFIYLGEGKPGQFLSQTKATIPSQLMMGATLKNIAHLLTVSLDYHYITSQIQFGLGPGLSPALFTIRIGRNPSRICFDRATGHLYSYYDSPVDGYDGEVTEATPVHSIKPVRL